MTRKRNKSSQKQAPLVDVVVTTAGRFDMLEKCLDRLKSESEVPINIIVIDNASDSEERIENSRLFDGVATKRLQENIGFPGAANEGARMGSAPIILFCSDDVLMADDAIGLMVKTLDDPAIGVVGAKMIFPPENMSGNRPAGKVQHVGLAMDIEGNIVHPLIGWNPENPRTKVSRDVLATTGGCLMIRRQLFSKAGGFDPIYGKGTYEDVDLCLTVRKLGFRIHLNAEAVAHHYVGATVEKRKEGYPLQINSLIWKSRWLASGLIAWDLWSYY